MITYARLTLVVLVATLFLAIGTTVATANRSIQIRGGERTVAVSGRLSFTSGILERSTEIACNVTVLRTISGVVPKQTFIRMGRVIGVAIDVGTRGPEIDARRETEHCTHGEAIEIVRRVVVLRIARNQGTPRELRNGIILYDVTGILPEWQLVYFSYTGFLPLVSGVLFYIDEALVLFAITGGFGLVRDNCLYQGRIDARVDVSREGAISRGEALLEDVMYRQSGGSFCPLETRLTGNFAVSPTLTIGLL